VHKSQSEFTPNSRSGEISMNWENKDRDTHSWSRARRSSGNSAI